MSKIDNLFAELQAEKKEKIPTVDEMFTDLALERQREAITNLKVFRDVTPEAGVSAIESSQEFGVPLPYTLRKQKEYEAERARKRQQEALINSTALSTFMADPQNAIMTSDSVAELAELERRLQDLSPGRGALAEITDVPRSVAAGAASLVGTGVRGIGETYRTAEEIQATLGIASGLEETYEAPGDNILMDVGGGVAELADIIRPEEQGFVDQVAEGLGQIAGAVGISFLPGGQAATMALFAGAGADQQAQRMRALGIDPASRPMDLAMGAGITGGSEALRLGSVLKVLPRSVRNRLAGGIMSRIAGQAGEEAIQEAFENIAQNMVAQGYDPEARLFEGAIESATVAGTSAAVFQALVEATLPGRQKQLNAQNFQKNMSDLREAVEATPAYERKRETVEQFIRQATNGETVLLDDAGVVELMQSAEGLQTLRDMGLTDEQIQQALAGNDIEVEAAKILVVKNNFDEIVSITRTHEGELTLVEAANEAFNEALQVDHDELIASLNEEDLALEGFENVERQVTQMMQEQNQPPEVAAKAGKLWGAFYKRLSEAGLDEQQIFEKLRLQMRGPEPRRQVGQLDIDLDDLRRGAIPSERASYGSTLQSMARTAGLYDKEGFLKRGVKEDGPLDEFGGMALDKGFFQERPSLNELEAILTSGQPYYRPENRDERRAARRETLLDLENRLDERGLDLNTMTNDEIVKVLMAEETQAEPEAELFQVNIQDLEELEELIEWGKKQASKNKETKKPEDKQLKEYPAAIPPEYEFSNYKEIGGKFVEMTPDQFLGLSAELYIDQDSKENIDDIAEIMLSGRKIDPPRLSVMQDGKIDSHDGRHRALAAKRLGIKKIPVLLIGENGSAFPQKVKTLKSQLGAKDRAFTTEIDEDGITYDQSGVINRDENFKRWFGDSKVVDEAGEPLVVYHGTRADIDAFQVSEGGTYGQGIYLTRDANEASFYADPADETVGAVYPVYVNIKNPAPENIASEAEAEATASGVSSIDILKSQGYDGIDTGGEIVAFDPTQIKSVNNRGTFDPNDPRILFQSAAIRRGEEVLNVPSKERIPKTRDVALALERRQREKYGTIERGDYSDEASEKIADFAVEEVMFEVEQAALNPEKSAVGWYSQKFQTALDVFGDVFPELVGDMDFSKPGVKLLGTQQNARDFFTALIAITSDGAKVEQNFRFAVDVMRGFRETGRIDHQVTFGGERNKSMQINLKNIQTALDDLGPDNLATQLLKTDTISNLKKIAKESGQSFSTAYKANMELPYAAVVFGPKLGAFYANLMGEAGYLTMDRWWSRTFNRYRGTLLTQPTEAGLARFKILVSQDQRLSEPPELMTDDEALARTVDYVRSYKAKGYKNGTEIEKAANTLYKAAFEGLEDQPFNASDREFMVNTTIRAQEKLSERGVDLTLADIQAVLWYYEKRLYAELGARATADISYEETARKIIEGDRGSATEKTLGGSELGLDAIGTESGTREVAEDIEEKLSQERELFQGGKAPSLRYAAVRVEGQVYTGRDHGEAAIKAEKAIGRPLRNINGEDGQSGFVGSDGKFYLRDEIDAALSALANDQITRDYMAKRIEKAIASGEKLPPLTSDMLTLFQQDIISDGFYSALERKVSEINMDRAPVDQWVKTIENLKGVKREELEWTGILDMLQARKEEHEAAEIDGPLVFEKADIVSAIQKRGVRVETIEATTDGDSGGGIVTFGEAETWDDPEAWEWLIEGHYQYLLGEPALSEQAAKEIADEEQEYIKNALGEDASGEAILEYARENFADEIEERHDVILSDRAEGEAREEYLGNPIKIISVRDGDGYQIAMLFGNDDSGWDVRTNMMDNSVVRSDIWSQEEAEIQAREWASEEGLIGDEEGVGERAQWEDYVTKGDYENYREFKITLPDVPGDFVEKSHFADPNIVAWARTTDRWLNDADALFIDEAQSDWHQQGRRGIYDNEKDRAKAQAMVELNKRAMGELKERSEALREKSEAAFQRLSVEYGKKENLLSYALKDMGVEFVNGVPLNDTETDATLDEFELALWTDRATFESFAENFTDPVRFGHRADLSHVFSGTNISLSADMQTYISAVVERLNVHRMMDKKAQAAEKGLTALSRPVPDAPFKGDAWINLLIKKMILQAVGEGKDAIAWADAQVVKNRWSDRYSELYENMYDKKMVKAAQKLLGAKAKHMDFDGEPIESRKTRTDMYVKAYEALGEDGADLRADLEANNIEDVVWRTEDVKRNHTGEIADNFVQELEAWAEAGGWSDTEGYWIIELTPEMRGRVKREGFTLFQQEGQGPRASVTFDPADILSDKDVLVRLTEAADKTSFLHESAHIFLEIYRSLDDGQNAFITQQMKDIREWLGAEEGKPFTTQQHETFAESFEVYLMEGKAPTRGMRAVFRTFKAWFTDVYRNLPLPKLNSKAREVFDAMLATDDEISAAQQEYTRNLSSTMSGLMDEELVAKYEDQARKAGELAREKLYRKFIDQINKRNSKEYKAAREEVEEQVRADVEARPPYRAFIALTTTDEQIDTKVIEQMRGKSAVAKIPRSKRGVHKKGGAHPDFVASKYGFTSGDAMLTALIGLRPIKETIAAEVEAELKRRFGDIENDGTAQREAIAAVFNEPSIKMMEAERDVLAQQAGKQPIPLEVFKQEAERRIRTMPIKDVIKPGRYAIKARDLHKRSIRSAANGKWDQALRETHQAMLQHELARRAFKAQDEVRRVKAYLKRSQRSMQKKGAEKRIASKYREQIIALLNLPGQPQQSEVLSQLQAFEKAQQADGKPVSLSGIDKPIPDLRDMSMDQLRDYRDNVKNLTKVGRDMSEEARVAKVKVAAELGDEVVKTWGSRNLKRMGGQRTVKTRGEKIRDWVRRKDAEVMRIPFIAEMWQGGKKGKLIDFFDIKLRMAMGQRNKHMADLDRQYVEILERHNITQSELHRVVSVPELTPVGDVKFEALLAVLLNMGSDGNVSRLLGDRMIAIDKKEDLIALLEQHLEKRHFDAAQEIWALIDTLRAPAFEQERKLTGVTPKRVDPTALVTSHGTYAGGYYPLRYDPELNRDITEKNAKEMWAQRVAGVASKAQTKQGFLKEREANSERPLHLSLSVAMEHFQEATTDIYLREPITQIWDVLKREQFANAVESTFGGAYLKAMETMLKRTAAGTQPPTSDVEKLLRGARVNATVAILGNNVVTAVLAPISYTQTVLTRYSAITVGRGMVSYYGNVVRANKLINEKSSFMRERTQNINREAHERITKQPFSSAYSRFQGSGFWLMASIEKATVSGPLWMGVYEQAIMEGKSEAVAVAEADRAVSTTQGSGLEMDQSVLQGGNEMERLVTFMWGYVSSVYGNTRAELGQEGAKRKTLAMVKFIAMSVVISSAIEALLRNGFGDEEDPYVVNWLKMMWRNSIGVLPGAGTFFSRYDARPAAFSAGTSVVEAADAYYKTGETFFEDGELDGEQAGKALLRTFEALGFAAGVPGTVQLNKLERTLLKDDDPTIIEALITGPDDDN